MKTTWKHPLTDWLVNKIKTEEGVADITLVSMWLGGDNLPSKDSNAYRTVATDLLEVSRRNDILYIDAQGWYRIKE